MSVVGSDFEKLKRFNIEELRQPLTSEPVASEETGESPDCKGEI
jgi:tRNA acetyltransferase TAN1